jgi:hypothetical protein
LGTFSPGRSLRRVLEREIPAFSRRWSCQACPEKTPGPRRHSLVGVRPPDTFSLETCPARPFWRDLLDGALCDRPPGHLLSCDLVRPRSAKVARKNCPGGVTGGPRQEQVSGKELPRTLRSRILAGPGPRKRAAQWGLAREPWFWRAPSTCASNLCKYLRRRWHGTTLLSITVPGDLEPHPSELATPLIYLCKKYTERFTKLHFQRSSSLRAPPHKTTDNPPSKQTSSGGCLLSRGPWPSVGCR